MRINSYLFSVKILSPQDGGFAFGSPLIRMIAGGVRIGFSTKFAKHI
jgi:hypothetical protein